MNCVSPEKSGFSSRRLQRLETVMQRYVAEGKYAGIVTLLARHGCVAHRACYGNMDIAANKPMQLDTIFRIFSMTKPITSVAILMLYEQGYFHLSDPVSRFIPGFRDVKVLMKKTEAGLKFADPEREITLRDLLTHTAGLSYGDDVQDPVDEAYQQARLMRMDEPLADKIAKLVKLPLAFNPGQGWRYSVATDVLGYVVEIVSGMPFSDFLETQIFEPLGMCDTDFYVPSEKYDRLAALYSPVKGGGLKDLGALDAEDEDAVYKLWLTMEKAPAFASGGGGLVSTVSDYLRFALMLRNQGELEGVRLLGRKTVELMTMNHLPKGLHPPFNEPAHGFGLGVKVQLEVAQSQMLGSVGTYGWGGAASTDFWLDPQEDLIGVLMTQLMPYGHYPLAQDFKVMAYQAIVD